ncbi:SIMPL domain-containing protein [Angustibacter peucedani]
MSVTVTGRGSASATPDTALVDLGCEAAGRTPDAALTTASQALAAVREVLREAGLPDSAVRSAELGVWPEHDRDGRPDGYRAGLGLVARVDDLDALGGLLGTAVRAGGEASRLRSVRLVVRDLTAARRAAREAAWGDARSAAEQLATLAGRTLGAVTEVRDAWSGGDDGRPPGPRFALAADSGPGVDAGVLDVTHAVTVTWDLA